MAGGWDGIDEFVAVARAGSFTAGAKAHGTSVTHMSRAVARLEGRLKVQLFNRTTRSLFLTEPGRVFLEQTERLTDEREEAIAAISQQDEPRGSLRVTCSYALGERFVSPIVRQFAQKHPNLNVTISLDNDIIDIVSRGYDLAVRTGHLEDSRLIATKVAQRELVTVASRDYLSRHKRPAKVSDLASHSCVVGSNVQWQFRRDQVFRPKGRWACNSGTAVLDACLAGMGICQIPAFYIGDHIAAGRLQTVLEDDKPDDEPIWAIYPTRRHLSPKISQLVNLLKEQLQPMLGSLTNSHRQQVHS